MGLGLSEIESGSVEKEKKAPLLAVAVVVAMSVGVSARTFRPWSWRERRVGNRFDNELVGRVSLTQSVEST